MKGPMYVLSKRTPATRELVISCALSLLTCIMLFFLSLVLNSRYSNADRTIGGPAAPEIQSTLTICPGAHFIVELLFSPGLNIREQAGGDIAGNDIIGTFALSSGKKEAIEQKQIGVDTYFHLKDGGWIWNKRLGVECLPPFTATATAQPTSTPAPTRSATPIRTPTPVTTGTSVGWWITFNGASVFCADPCRPEFSRQLPTRGVTVTRLP